MSDQGAKAMVKIQLEIPEHVLEAYKEKAKGTQRTPKQIMERVLAEGAAAE